MNGLCFPVNESSLENLGILSCFLLSTGLTLLLSHPPTQKQYDIVLPRQSYSTESGDCRTNGFGENMQQYVCFVPLGNHFSDAFFCVQFYLQHQKYHCIYQKEYGAHLISNQCIHVLIVCRSFSMKNPFKMLPKNIKYIVCKITISVPNCFKVGVNLV